MAWVISMARCGVNKLKNVYAYTDIHTLSHA